MLHALRSSIQTESIDLKLEEDKCAVIGPVGSGKSVLHNLIGLLGHAAAGKQLTKVGVAGHEYEKHAQLPGGQQQRVASAGALALSWNPILADEPTDNLDPYATAEIFELICELHREHGNACLIVAHDPASDPPSGVCV